MSTQISMNWFPEEVESTIFSGLFNGLRFFAFDVPDVSTKISMFEIFVIQVT